MELKKHKSLAEQVMILENRGLIVENQTAAVDLLFRISYYRLSGYLHHFKDPVSDHYQTGLSLEQIKRIYDFDRKFTRILLFALGDIEETLKTRISYTVTEQFHDDPIIYLKPTIYRDYPSYLRFVSSYYETKENNRKLPFVEHHNKKYHGFLPMWVAFELLTMGNLHAVFDNLISPLQKRIAKSYHTGRCQLGNWIKNLTYTRNHLAHYMRVYNFNFGRTPSSCKNHPKNFRTSNMIFDQIYTISCMYSDGAEWKYYVVPEMRALLDEYNDVIELSGLGFPHNWEEILNHTSDAAPERIL